MSNTNETCVVHGCTNPAKPERTTEAITLTICREHVWDLAAWHHESARNAMAEVKEQGLLLGPTKGWTYVIRLSNGNVKIGKGGTRSKALADRLQSLSTNQGVPVHVPAVLQGGTSTELLTHKQWLHLRVPGRMEEFYPDPSLLQWAEEQGIHPDAGLEDYFGWQERKHADPKRNKAEQWAKRLNVSTRLTGELSKDPRADWSPEVKTEEDWKF